MAVYWGEQGIFYYGLVAGASGDNAITTIPPPSDLTKLQLTTSYNRVGEVGNVSMDMERDEQEITSFGDISRRYAASLPAHSMTGQMRFDVGDAAQRIIFDEVNALTRQSDEKRPWVWLLESGSSGPSPDKTKNYIPGDSGLAKRLSS